MKAATISRAVQSDVTERKPSGVVVLGGAHGALAVARSVGRNGIPMLLVSDDFTLVRLSRYVKRCIAWSGPKDPRAVDRLLDLAATEGLQGWVLIPGGDAEVRLIAENRSVLSQVFGLLSCDWNVLQTVCDKQKLAETAARAGIAAPKSYAVRSEAAAVGSDLQYPVVLKPATREVRNAFTLAKAWRADSRAEFVERYRSAAALVGNDQVVVQELIPGGGEAQFSYVGLWQDGRPLAAMTARRTRQYPADFSYTSTFVEVVDRPEVRAAAEVLLASIAFEGLVEVEFKYDARDRTYKALDVNPRTWTWFGLAEAAGIDFTVLMMTAIAGGRLAPVSATPGHKWIYAIRDVVVGFQLIARGDLSLPAYLASLRGPMTWAAFALDDPLPGLLEMPLTAYRVVTKRLPALRSKPRSRTAPCTRPTA